MNFALHNNDADYITHSTDCQSQNVNMIPDV